MSVVVVTKTPKAILFQDEAYGYFRKVFIALVKLQDDGYLPRKGSPWALTINQVIPDDWYTNQLQLSMDGVQVKSFINLLQALPEVHPSRRLISYLRDRGVLIVGSQTLNKG